MRLEPARWCPKCHLRIAPYELQRVHRKRAYHQHCFSMLLREEAEREKVQRLEAGQAKAVRQISA